MLYKASSSFWCLCAFHVPLHSSDSGTRTGDRSKWCQMRARKNLTAEVFKWRLYASNECDSREERLNLNKRKRNLCKKEKKRRKKNGRSEIVKWSSLLVHKWRWICKFTALDSFTAHLRFVGASVLIKSSSEWFAKAKQEGENGGKKKNQLVDGSNLLQYISHLVSGRSSSRLVVLDSSAWFEEKRVFLWVVTVGTWWLLLIHV